MRYWNNFVFNSLISTSRTLKILENIFWNRFSRTVLKIIWRKDTKIIFQKIFGKIYWKKKKRFLKFFGKIKKTFSKISKNFRKIFLEKFFSKNFGKIIFRKNIVNLFEIFGKNKKIVETF